MDVDMIEIFTISKTGTVTLWAVTYRDMIDDEGAIELLNEGKTITFKMILEK